jgi:hypothetical protein
MQRLDLGVPRLSGEFLSALDGLLGLQCEFIEAEWHGMAFLPLASHSGVAAIFAAANREAPDGPSRKPEA